MRNQVATLRRTISMSHLALAVVLCGVPAVAAAQPGEWGWEPPPSYTDGGRFTVRNLRLNGDDQRIRVPSGGTVTADMELWHHCRTCGGAINQVIVGIAGEPRAQACVYNGGAATAGYQRVQFNLNVPNVPGRYEVRVRYAQAWNCQQALDWWRVNQPEGPGREATIGIVAVRTPGGGGGGGRLPSSQVLRADLDQRLSWIEQQTVQIEQLAMGPPGQNRGRIVESARQIREQMQSVRALERDWQAAVEREMSGRPNVPPPSYPPAYPPVTQPPVVMPPPPPVVVVQPPPPVLQVGPQPMSPPDFQAMVQRLRAQGFENSRMNQLDDTINSGVYFTTAQALQLMGLFSFDSSKVKVGAKLCPVIVERGALPQMTAALTFESSRQQLRSMTGGRCGLQ